MQRTTVFYEDSAAGPIKEYGPHMLVCACVADHLGKNVFDVLDFVDPVPSNGGSNLRKECKRVPPTRIVADGRRAFALYDADKIHEELKRPPATRKRDIADLLRKECAWGERLEVVLLTRNLETVLDAICALQPTIATAETRELAVRKKRLNERDIVLRAAAFSDKALRDALLVQVPSLGCLVTRIAAELVPPPPASR
jgi:hypothetical protein